MTAILKVPETAAPGEIVEIKLLIRHPMETGFRTGPDGQLVPRDIIEEVFRAELFPAITANPFLVFRLRVDGPSDVTLVWRDREGERRETRRIELA